MNSKERVRLTLTREGIPDRIPIQFDLCKSLIEYYSQHLGIDPGFSWSYYEDLSYRISANEVDLRSCTDLYQIMFSIEDGGEETGSILIDSIELVDGTEDCIPVVGEMLTDMNGDCDVNMLDFAEIAEGWLNGL